jgi:hypothetical protein
VVGGLDPGQIQLPALGYEESEAHNRQLSGDERRRQLSSGRAA